MITFIYVLILFLLTFYSYSQIDLNLTLSANPYYQAVQNQLIYLGYYNRSLSTYIFLIIFFCLFFFYFLFLYQARHNHLSSKKIYLLILFSIIFLIFSYPGFSHDIFNYMFDARMITKYHTNPYLHSALDFPDDLWTRFMHWTHRRYPYGPIWLVITTPFSFMGFGKFVPTLMLFKLMFICFHLLNIYLIYKILRNKIPKYTLSGVVFYAFNPLIIIESIVSPHNEVMMLSFLLLAIYFGVINKRIFVSFLALVFSAGVKFTTASVFPLFIIIGFLRKKFNFERIIEIFLLFLLFPFLILIINREPYPWYLIIFVGIGALLGKFRFMHLLIICQSLGALLRYAPYLYFGEYSLRVSLWQNIVYLIPTVILIFWIISRQLFRKGHLHGGVI